MEENNDQVKEAVNEIKNTIKDVNFKSGSEETKNLFSAMLQNPVGKIKEIVKDASKYLKTAIILTIIWVVVVTLRDIISSVSIWGIEDYFENFFKEVLDTLKIAVYPILTIAIFSVATYLVKKDKKVTEIIPIVTIAKAPVILSAVIGMLNLLPAKVLGFITRFVSPIQSILSILSAVLLYIGLRELFEEEDEVFIKKYVLIYGIYLVATIVLSFFKLYI